MVTTIAKPDHGNLDRSLELALVQMVFVVVAGLCLLARAYIKFFILKINLLDDYLLYGSMVTYVAYSAIVIECTLNGATGKHPSLDITIEQGVYSLRGWYVCMLMYPIITLAIRGSLCVLLFRLNSKRSLRWIIWLNLAITNVATVAFFLILVFQCNPPAYFWRQLYGGEGYCRSKMMVTYSTTVYSVLSALSDWCLGLLPIAILWSVNINLRTKVVITGLLSLGMIAGIVLIVRATYVTRLEPGFLFLYEATDVAIWSVMEPALGIIAACVATFRPLFKNCGFGWSSRARGHSTYYQNPENGSGESPVHPPSPWSPGFDRCFDAVGSKSVPDGRSEQKLAIHKTAQINLAPAAEMYTKPTSRFSPSRRTTDGDSFKYPGRVTSWEGPYSTDPEDKSAYNNRVTV